MSKKQVIITKEVYAVYSDKRRSYKDKEFEDLEQAVSHAEQCSLLGDSNFFVRHEIYIAGRKSPWHRCTAYNTIWPDSRKPLQCVNIA